MASSVNTLLVTALHAEAKPLVRHFGMVKDTAETRVETYYGNGFALVVSGVGKVRAAVATASFLARQPEVSELHLLNIGIAGAVRSAEISIGDLFLVNRIVDDASGREFFPDMLIKTELRETLLTTADRPVTSSEEGPPYGLVDMEGAGVFEAAAAYLAPHRISLLKIVSDFLDGVRLKREAVSALVEKHLSEIDRFLKIAQSSAQPAPPVIGEAEQQWLEEVTASLRLTTSQRRLLRTWAAAFIVCRRRKLPKLSRDLMERPHDTRERSARLEAIKQRLATGE